MLTSVLTLALTISSAMAASVQVNNRCNFDVWTNLATGSPDVTQAELSKGKSTTVAITGLGHSVGITKAQGDYWSVNLYC
ncbi:hypothetical protein K470DRAFT_257350 [Piedraia hortae CBS 480.64]|uniref:Uncharacterized protein n=1 Tax=Piedraia hortae CBS 480.64 TaxID=1314780 RepID=A0A6A7C1X4_9PEZI|nr:hypothetical protein K470DRAFT_257350 [Piedraia hortae CBS 480.64]